MGLEKLAEVSHPGNREEIQNEWLKDSFLKQRTGKEPDKALIHEFVLLAIACFSGEQAN
jgi:hypothetical protein